jgi:hypothetical protein
LHAFSVSAAQQGAAADRLRRRLSFAVGQHKKTVICLVALSLQACGSLVALNSSDTTVSFVETDSAGQVVRELAFALTDQPWNACIAGSWKKARVIKDLGKYTRDSVYKVENGTFEVLPVSGICDSYDSYVGHFSDATFDGVHVIYGWDVTPLGKVTGSQER